MNLHDITTPLGPVALWLYAYGANGRGIGTHLWEVPEGEPIRTPATRPGYHTLNSWTPPLFSWQPFTFTRTFRDGYVPPLCGHRSASRTPRINSTGTAGTCAGCIAAANARGIVALTYAEALNRSPRRGALIAERERWVEAGRPSPWPSPSDTPTS